VAATDPDLRLVVAGPDGWGVERFDDAVAGSHHRARIGRLGWVTEVQRADLLAGALLLAYPSRYEGFGLPPLEAMAAGVPVVATRAGALPETLGDAAVLVDPGDVDALAGAIGEVAGDDALRRDLVQRGRARAARYSWDRCAGELLALYRRRAGDGATGR
jgi:alpha-1,3-rhamnosyl/mannosyltransferase